LPPQCTFTVALRHLSPKFAINEKEEERAMTHYKLHLIDCPGRIESRFVFGCPDDREAILAAEELREKRAMELYCGDRLVRAWAAAPAVAPEPTSSLQGAFSAAPIPT
jgi:hypothetical protein